jgi:hypothetical protein
MLYTGGGTRIGAGRHGPDCGVVTRSVRVNKRTSMLVEFSDAP